MGEFKFACPVCGQHITADSSGSGSKLECPTCYRQIVVPQAPSAESQKFILSAAEANKPRPSQAPQSSSGFSVPAQSNKTALFIAFAVLLIGGVTTVWFVWQKKNLPPGQVEKTTAPLKTNAPTSTVEWRLELADAAIPEANATGRIHGRDFNYERAILQGGLLTLRHGTSGLTDLGVCIYLPQKQGEAWSGQSVVIETNRPRSPRVQLRWKDANQPRIENFTNGYAMKLEFGQAVNGRVPGKIYLCAPDESKSCLAGVFDAEIRKPVPPKPRTFRPSQKKPQSVQPQKR